MRPSDDLLPRWPRGRGPRVVVAGAGVAGLVAARELERAGCRVTVVEASDRVGGRVRTFRDLPGGAHAEAGADLFEGGHDDLYALLDELGLERVRVLRGGFRWRTRSGREEDGAWDVVERATQPLGEALDAVGRTWTTAVEAAYARRSVADWLAAVRASPTLRRRCEGMSRGLFLGAPTRLSLLSFADEATGDAGTGPRGPFFRLRGGNDLLATRLAQGLRHPVRLRRVVERVDTSPRGVRLGLRAGSRSERLEADAAVVALPPPPLSRVAFGPPLPPDQARAVATTRLGPVVKGALVLRRRAWGATGARAWATEPPLGAIWDAGEGQRGRPPLLAVHAGGDLSAPIARLSEPERIAFLARVVARRLPGAEVVDGRTVAWEREPFAGGGYAVLEAGDDPRLRAVLARPFGRVAFAGEHTSREHPGYVNGAVVSGRRAALEVRALFAPGASRREAPRSTRGRGGGP